jgi:hypothetical protein
MEEKGTEGRERKEREGKDMKWKESAVDGMKAKKRVGKREGKGRERKGKGAREVQ